MGSEPWYSPQSLNAGPSQCPDQAFGAVALDVFSFVTIRVSKASVLTSLGPGQSEQPGDERRVSFLLIFTVQHRAGHAAYGRMHDRWAERSAAAPGQPPPWLSSPRAASALAGPEAAHSLCESILQVNSLNSLQDPLTWLQGGAETWTTTAYKCWLSLPHLGELFSRGWKACQLWWDWCVPSGATSQTPPPSLLTLSRKHQPSFLSPWSEFLQHPLMFHLAGTLSCAVLWFCDWNGPHVLLCLPSWLKCLLLKSPFNNSSL